MDLSDLFDFNNRVEEDTTMIKIIDGAIDEKEVKSGFNWLGGIFTLFYALFSNKYKTEGFVKKIAIPFVMSIAINIVLERTALGVIANIAECVWFGLMYDTWFKNQLIANGYTEKSVNNLQKLTDKKEMIECPNCHAKMQPTTLFCTDCGTNLTAIKHSKKAQSQFNKLISCPKCQSKNQWDAKFCVNCGADLTTPVNKTCPQCKSKVEPDKSFCPTCGYKFN